MDKKRLVTAIGVVALLTLTGAGCGGPILKREGVPTEKTDTAAETKEVLESYITKTFGEVKVTSLVNDFPSKGSIGIEYSVSRPTSQKDLDTLENLLKRNGIKTESSKDKEKDEEDVNAVVGEGKTHLFIFTIEKFGERKVGAMLMPIPEDYEELKNEE